MKELFKVTDRPKASLEGSDLLSKTKQPASPGFLDELL